MQAASAKALAVAMAAVLALGTADAWAAKKKSAKRSVTPTITRDYDGTPIIMKGYDRTLGIPDIMREEKGAPRRAERPPVRPRGSSTYVPPPVPSPNSPNSPPSPVLLQPPPPPVVPPPINTFQDRVINCIHSAPLNAGVGNNPANPQAYVRQCAN
jgi:hypothetical protein